jgi:hyaluronoglucosaminidase
VLVATAALVGGCGAAGSGAGNLEASTGAGALLYVCNYGSDAVPGTTIAPIDPTTLRPEPRVTIGSLPSSLASTPDGRQLLVTAQGDDDLVVLDTLNDTVLGRVSTGLEPDAVAVTPDGKTAVVANFGDGTVTPVSLATFTAGHPVSVGSEPDAVAVTPDGKTAVVANFGDGTVTPVSLATSTAGPPVPVGPGPTAIVTSPVSRAGGAAVWVGVGASLVPLSSPALSPEAPVTIGHIVEAVSLGGDGRTAWVAGQEGAITSVDLATGQARSGTRLSGRPSAIAVAPPSR